MLCVLAHICSTDCRVRKCHSPDRQAKPRLSEVEWSGRSLQGEMYCRQPLWFHRISKCCKKKYKVYSSFSYTTAGPERNFLSCPPLQHLGIRETHSYLQICTAYLCGDTQQNLWGKSKHLCSWGFFLILQNQVLFTHWFPVWADEHKSRSVGSTQGKALGN